MQKGKTIQNRGASGHLETMESRTLLSVASAMPFIGPLHFQAFDHDAAPHLHMFAVEDNPAAHSLMAVQEVIVGASAGEGYAPPPILIGFWSQTPHPDFDHHDFPGGTSSDGSSYRGGTFSNYPVNPPPQVQPHQGDSDDSDDRAVIPAAVPARVADHAQSSISTATDTLRQSTSIASRLLDSTAVQAVETIAQGRTAAVITPVLASSLTHSFQISLQPGRLVAVYLSALGQADAGGSFFSHLAADVKQIVNLPAIALRETGFVMMAAGPQMISSPAVSAFARFAPPFTLVADSIGSFIKASAMIPLASTPAAAAHRAWTITAVVIAADMMLLTYYIHRQRKANQALAVETVMER